MAPVTWCIQQSEQTSEDVNIGKAIRGALAGWGGMTAMVMAGRQAGMTKMSVLEMEGSLFAPPHTTKAKVIGLVTHLGMSLWIGLAYGLGFELAGLKPSWRTGALGGLLHWAIATVTTGVASKRHPKREQRVMPAYG